jgi:hypothetical protein
MLRFEATSVDMPRLIRHLYASLDTSVDMPRLIRHRTQTDGLISLIPTTQLNPHTCLTPTTQLISLIPTTQLNPQPPTPPELPTPNPQPPTPPVFLHMQDRLKLEAIIGQAPVETPDHEPPWARDDSPSSAFLTHLHPDDLHRSASATSSRTSSAAHPHRPALARAPAPARPPAPSKGPPKVMGKPGGARLERGPGGPRGGGRGAHDAGTPPSGGQAPKQQQHEEQQPRTAVRRGEALAVAKPETPADLASMFKAHKEHTLQDPTGGKQRTAARREEEEEEADAASFAPYGKAPKGAHLDLSQVGAGGGGGGGGGGRGGYHQLLSPEARSMLEDARTWHSSTHRSTATGKVLSQS